MHTKEIQAFIIAQTRVNWPQVELWLKALGVLDVEKVLEQVCSSGDCLPGGVRVATDASALVALCGKRCYNSFEVNPALNPNITKIREEHAEYITNVLASRHGSVLEHATWSIAIEGVSRVFTGEMNRHRAGVAISEASMRYIRFDDVGFWMPGSLTCDEAEAGIDTPDHVSNLEDQERGDRKLLTQEKLKEAFAGAEKIYIDLCNIWKIEEMKDFTKKKHLTSMFRRIIGMGIATGGIWTINARALRWILQLRTSVHAEEEIREAFDKVANLIVPSEPLLFGDFIRNEWGAWVPTYEKV